MIHQVTLFYICIIIIMVVINTFYSTKQVLCISMLTFIKQYHLMKYTVTICRTWNTVTIFLHYIYANISFFFFYRKFNRIFILQIMSKCSKFTLNIFLLLGGGGSAEEKSLEHHENKWWNFQFWINCRFKRATSKQVFWTRMFIFAFRLLNMSLQHCQTFNGGWHKNYSY